MAFDFTKLSGYSDSMTAEEKLALLDTYEPPTPDLTGFIRKDAFDKTASELAEAKKLLKAKMTEDEQKEAERAAKEAEKDALLESLKRDKAVSERKAKYLAFGYDEKLAAETAKAFADGDMDTVDKNHALHIENVRKAERAAALAGDPKPPAGGVSKTQIDYSKEIAEAQANSDFGTAAMFMRQQQETIMKKT
jgi:hypothetical protein